MSVWNPSTKRFVEDLVTVLHDADLNAAYDAAVLDAKTGAIPAGAGQLFGGSGVAGVPRTIAVGSGLSLSSGTLTATYVLPIATTLARGGVRPDGTTITIAGDVISATGGGYTLPVATSTVLGGVKQGGGITIAGDGTITATGTSGVGTFNTRTGAVTLTTGDVTGVLTSGLPVANGGTGATTPAAARVVLGISTVGNTGVYADLTGTPTIPVASSATPLVNGTAAVGSSTNYAREGHVHPTDTSRDIAATTLTHGALTNTSIVPFFDSSGNPFYASPDDQTAYTLAASSIAATTLTHGTLTNTSIIPFFDSSGNPFYGSPDDQTAYTLAKGGSFTKAVAVTPVSLTYGATTTINATLGNNFRIVLTGNVTFANPTGLVDGQEINLRIKQDGTGSRTAAWGTKWKWGGGAAPTLTTTANAVDRVSGIYVLADDVIEATFKLAYA